MTDMKKEMLISTFTSTLAFALFIGVIEANTYVAQVLFAGSAVAVYFYHLHLFTRGFSIDAELAQKSLAIGAVAAMPVADHLVS